MGTHSEAGSTKSSLRLRSNSEKEPRGRSQQPTNEFQDWHQQQMHMLGQPDVFYGSQADYGGFMASGQQQRQTYAGQFQEDPMADMAMQYGQSLAQQGTDLVNKSIEKYIVLSKLKYYFSVDTVYVGKKLGLLCYPYSHQNWAVEYDQSEPVPPRDNVNAPDLYIPAMAFVTFILVSGVVSGTRGRFSPEQLKTQATSSLVWLIIEYLIFSLSLYLLNINTCRLRYLDIAAYCGYKFVGMTGCLLACVTFGTEVYLFVLAWFCAALAFFLVQSLRPQVLPQEGGGHSVSGTKRGIYFILSLSLSQLFLMWWLTSQIIFSKTLL